MAHEYRGEKLVFSAGHVGGRLVQTAKIGDYTVSIHVTNCAEMPFRADVKWDDRSVSTSYLTADQAVAGSCAALANLDYQRDVDREFERRIPLLEGELQKLSEVA